MNLVFLSSKVINPEILTTCLYTLSLGLENAVTEHSLQSAFQALACYVGAKCSLHDD